ncbi:hypothetical protein Pla175_00570 [Pirellulimonas nuda]|uniref:Uncharacterized protein n=1 Tax=Pirellulimonas nuda TaxID=2528009 RepID=A0A518D5F4_9BACT|nr:hypothetical protein [Pirellulimonas nuda]QDU86707.1 hypothetical protein Pla175_00570 [Pirellulimonas nuda]
MRIKSRTNRLGLLALLLVGVASLAPAENNNDFRRPPLRDRLVYGLLARRPVELEFLERVIFAVEQRRLPEVVVDRTFFYARRKAPTQGGEFTQRPIIYFMFAMQAQADKLRVELVLPP